MPTSHPPPPSGTPCLSTTPARRRAPGAADPYLAGPDPDDVGGQAAALSHRSRPGVPTGHSGHDAHAGVPSDRGLGHRSGHQSRAPRRNDRSVHRGVLRSRLHEPPPSELLSVHGTVRGVRHSPGRWSLAGARRLWHGPSPRARRRRHRSRGVDGFAFGFGIDRLAKERHGVDDLREMYTGDIASRSSSSWRSRATGWRTMRRSPTTSNCSRRPSTVLASRLVGSPMSVACRVSSRRGSLASNGTLTPRRLFGSGSTPATGPSTACGAGRRTLRLATSYRWRRSARRCPTAARSAPEAFSASLRTACSARRGNWDLARSQWHPGTAPGVPPGVPYGEVTRSIHQHLRCDVRQSA